MGTNKNTISFTHPFRGGEKIIIAGGGTGGHIFPAIAIANALKMLHPGIHILFIGAKGKMEMEKVPQAGYEIKGLDIAGFNRQSLLKNVGLPLKLIKSFFQVQKIFREFKPDAVIGVGGYSSFPVLRYAQSKGIDSFIHESNAFAGKANIFLGKKATKIFVASEGMEKFFPENKIMITGNPVRKNITDADITREQGLDFFGLDSNKKTVLAIGGSLGARSINEAIARNIDVFDANHLQLITEMEMAYAAADMVISRAGAMSVAELCVTGKPVIFVPFPFAAEDHQTSNAMYLVNKQAGLMVKDSEAAEKLTDMVIALSQDEELQQTLSRNSRALAIVNADEIIAKKILTVISAKTK